MITQHDHAEAIRFVSETTKPVSSQPSPTLAEPQTSVYGVIAHQVNTPYPLPVDAETEEPRFAVRMSTAYEVFDRRDGTALGRSYATLQDAIVFCNALNKAATARGRWDQ